MAPKAKPKATWTGMDLSKVSSSKSGRAAKGGPLTVRKTTAKSPAKPRGPKGIPKPSRLAAGQQALEDVPSVPASKARPAGRPSAPKEAPDWLITGKWAIESQAIADGYSVHEGMEIVLWEVKRTSRAEGTFHLGILEGILRTAGKAPAGKKAAAAQVKYEWQGFETGEGERDMAKSHGVDQDDGPKEHGGRDFQRAG